MISREIYTKNKFKDNELIDAITKTLNIGKEEVLIIKNSNGWLKKENQSVVVEYNGLLDDEDTDQYIGYYYYDIWFDNDKNINLLKTLENNLGDGVVIELY